jgi:hypothetical protein
VTRVQVGEAARLRSPIFANGDGVRTAPASTPTCTVTSHRGADPGALTVTESGTAEYYATLPAQSAPDLLTVTWAGTVDSQAVSYVDEVKVVADHYASLVELRDSVSNKPSTTTRRLEALRDEFAARVAEYRGESWTSEYEVLTITVPEGGYRVCGTITLPWCVDVALVSVTDPDAADVTSDWTVTTTGRLSPPTAVLAEGTHTIAYTHGVDEPYVLNRACVDWVKSSVMRGDAGTARDIIWQGMDGTVRYSTPDPMAGRPTGLMDVDAVLNALPDHRQINV